MHSVDSNRIQGQGAIVGSEYVGSSIADTAYGGREDDGDEKQRNVAGFGW